MSTTTELAEPATDPAERIGALRGEIDACDTADHRAHPAPAGHLPGDRRAAHRRRRHPAVAGPRAADPRQVPGRARPGRRRARHDAAPAGPRPPLRSASRSPRAARPPMSGMSHPRALCRLHGRTPTERTTTMARISLDPPRTLLYRLTEWYSRRRFGRRRRPRGRHGPQHAGADGQRPLRDVGGQVAPARPDPQAPRRDGRVGHHRLLVVRGLRLLGRHQRGHRPGQAAERAALAGERRLHRPGAARPRVRRGGDGDPAGRHRRDGRGPAPRSGRRRAGRADHDDRRGEPAVPVQQRPRASPARASRTAARSRRPLAAARAGRRDDLAAATCSPPSTGTGGCCSTVAYQMLGSVADAEDVVQDAWLRWSAADRDGRRRRARLPGADRLPAGAGPAALGAVAAGDLRRPLAARAAGDRAGVPAAGTPTRPRRPSSASRCRWRCSSSWRRSPRSSGRSSCCARCSACPPPRSPRPSAGREAAVRQLAHRAREHVQARRPRFDTDRRATREVTERFLAAAVGGDVEACWPRCRRASSSCPTAAARSRRRGGPIVGADKVARFLAAIAPGGPPRPGCASALAEVNGAPAVVAWNDAGPLMALQLVLVDGRSSRSSTWRNPDKLAGIAAAIGRPPPVGSGG